MIFNKIDFVFRKLLLYRDMHFNRILILAFSKRDKYSNNVDFLLDIHRNKTFFYLF